MGLSTTDEIIIGGVAGVVIVVIGIFLCWRRRRHRRSFYIRSKDKITERYVPTTFDRSASWRGEQGFEEAAIDEQQSSFAKQREIYTIAMKRALNYMRATTLHRREIVKDIPCIGNRTNLKFFYVVEDEVLTRENRLPNFMMSHYDVSKLPSYVDSSGQTQLGSGRILDPSDPDQVRALNFATNTLRHPNVAKTYEVGTSRDSRNIFFFREVFPRGTIKDLIYNSVLSKPYWEKYGKRKGKALKMQHIRRYGRQVLEGMIYLEKCGMPFLHLHTGNVVLKKGSDKIGDALLIDYELGLLGLLPKRKIHEDLIQVRSLTAQKSIPIVLQFGYFLFEMACGFEVPASNPLDVAHKLDPKLPGPILRVMGMIFGDQSLSTGPSLESLLLDPLFNVGGVRPVNTARYDKLKKENHHVERFATAGANLLAKTYHNEKAMIVADRPEVKKVRKSFKTDRTPTGGGQSTINNL